LKTSIKDTAVSQREALEQEEARIVAEFSKPPPTVVFRPANPKFYRKSTVMKRGSKAGVKKIGSKINVD